MILIDENDRKYGVHRMLNIKKNTIIYRMSPCPILVAIQLLYADFIGTMLGKPFPEPDDLVIAINHFQVD